MGRDRELPMQDWLVFETNPTDLGAGAPSSHWDAMGHQQAPPRAILTPYNCVGAVRAPDEATAVQAVMSYTRRIGKYAVIPATILDFSFKPDAQATGQQVQLNPGGN